MNAVSELPADIITKLMRIAEKCVIRSHKVSLDEIQDFVQNCLVKLLVQVNDQRVTHDVINDQYFVIRKNGSPLEIERWFGTAAANISIDHYRKVKNEVDIDGITPIYDEQETTSTQFSLPEMSINLEEELQENTIKKMALFCADALDHCMIETWDHFIQDNYKNLTLSFTEQAPIKDKAYAVANYCQLLMEEKYNNDGRKSQSHSTVCDALGMIINPENIVHKKKKFEKIMLSCITKKVDHEFEGITEHVLQRGT